MGRDPRHDRTKTLRRKIRRLTSAEHTVRDWQSALARTWATEHDDDWATLAVDGHVKVSLERSAAETLRRAPEAVFAGDRELWVNALAPLLCLTRRSTRN